MVLVKDPAMIGRKIDCTTCKYRFVVPDPEDLETEEEEEEEAPAKPAKKTKPDATAPAKKPAAKAPGKGGSVISTKPAVKTKPGKPAAKLPVEKEAGEEGEDEDAPAQPKAKTKAETKKMLILGGALGVVAVLALGIGGYALFGTSPTKPKKLPPKPPNIAQQNTNVPGTNTPGTTTPTPTPAGPTEANITNLLPPDTEAVRSFSVDKLLASSFRQAALNTPGAFSETAFRTTFGFPLEEVSRVVIAANLTKPWTFAVARTTKPIDPKLLTTRLKLTTEKPVNGHTYHLIKRDLDALGNVLFKANLPHEKLALYFFDPKTLIFADLEPLEAFLKKAKPPSTASQAAPMPKDMGMGTVAGTTPATAPAAVPDKPADDAGSYMTISQDLKSVLDQLEKGDQAVLMSEVGDLRDVAWEELKKHVLNQQVLRGLPLPGFKTTQTAAELETLKQEIKILGFSVDAFKEDRVAATVAILAVNVETAKKWDEKLRAALEKQPLLTNPHAGPMPRPNTGSTQPPMDSKPLVSTSLVDKMLVVRARIPLPLTLPAPLPSLSYQTAMTSGKGLMIQARSVAELLNRRPRIHELAAATQAYLRDKGQFPQGTVKREDDNRLSDFPPNQRLSWIPELLPYLGEGDYKGLSLKENGSWRESDNLAVAQMVIPQLLAETPAGTPPRIKFPGLGGEVGPTHYIGVAGVGLDAAEYRADDAAVAGKLGIFGYYRITKKDDIKDGLDKTILLLQMPISNRLPWLAGGGSTVRGISEEADCLQPFICHERERAGKKERGALAIMADGKVRFIPSTTPPEVFRALCTINGGEKIDNLEAIAPEIPPEPTEVELRTDPTVARPGSGWPEYRSAEGRYSVQLPAGKASDDSSKGSLGELGEAAALTHSVALANGSAYGVVCFDLSPEVAAKGADAVFEAMKNALPLVGLGQGAKVLSEKKISLGDVMGRDWTIDCPQNGSKARAYHFLAGNRLYHVVAIGPAGKLDDKDAQTFLESFRITAPKEKPMDTKPPPAPGGK